MNRLKKYFCCDFKVALLLIPFFLFPFYTAKAQMFSVRSQGHYRSTPSVNIYLGYQPAKFYYKPSGSGTKGLVDYGFTGPIYRLQLELSSIDLYVANGWSLGSKKSLNYFNIGAHIQGYLRAIHTPIFSLQFPVRLQTDYIQVQSKQSTSNDNMQESAGTIGVGPMITLRLGNLARFSSNVLLNYGFSVRSMGTSSGTLYDLINSNRFYFDNLFSNVGLSVGFDYDFRRYNMSGIQYDYAFRGYSFLIGVSF